MLHGFESRVHLAQGLAVGDELINLQGAAHVVTDEAREL
jgi:hypothetical protein